MLWTLVVDLEQVLAGLPDHQYFSCTAQAFCSVARVEESGPSFDFPQQSVYGGSSNGGRWKFGPHTPEKMREDIVLPGERPYAPHIIGRPGQGLVQGVHVRHGA